MTVKIREEIKQSKETVKALSNKYHLNPKTIMRFKHAESMLDKKRAVPQILVLLSAFEEQVICALDELLNYP